jgi:hypothetical protein
MKQGLLQNPAVVGALAVSALLIVGLQFRKPKRGAAKPGTVAAQSAGRKANGSATARTAKGSADTAGARSVPESDPASLPPGERADPADETEIDIGYLNQRLAKWVESPNRDPFGYYPKPPPSDLMTTSRTNASELLKVSAIWRQTGRRLAVINGKVLGESSEIQGFRVDQIDATVVRLTGPHGPDQIVLAEFGKPPASLRSTNGVPSAVTAVGNSGPKLAR